MATTTLPATVGDNGNGSGGRAIAAQKSGLPVAAGGTEERTLVVAWLGDQAFGLDVLRVRDVLAPERIAPVPLAPPQVAGMINLRGRIVTVLDTRRRLGLAPVEGARLCITVEEGASLYGLLFDSVTEVMALDPRRIEPNPPHLAPAWREASRGVVPMDGSLMVVVDVDALLAIPGSAGGAR